jgi:hypothetical protein
MMELVEKVLVPVVMMVVGLKEVPCLNKLMILRESRTLLLSLFVVVSMFYLLM